MQLVKGLALSFVVLAGSSLAAAEKDIVDTAVGAKKFNTLVAAVKAAGLVETLKGKGPFTVFAPTDDAFAKIPKKVLGELLKPENKDKLTAILTYHVVPGRVLAADVVKIDSAKTVQGSSATVTVKGGKVMIDKANVVATDILCTNGVIHVIDSVIMPPAKPVKSSDARKMLERAVAKGAHLYNTGHHARCATVYHTAMTELADRGVEGTCSSTQRMMTTLVTRAAAEPHAGRRAWMLRHGIDAMYTSLVTAE